MKGRVCGRNAVKRPRWIWVIVHQTEQKQDGRSKSVKEVKTRNNSKGAKQRVESRIGGRNAVEEARWMWITV